VKEIIVEHATLHQSVPIKGWGAPEKTLHKSRMPGIKMSLYPQGLAVFIKDKQGNSVGTLVPLPNVAAMQLEDWNSLSETKVVKK
jgi:hypothetical protein